MVKLMRKMYQVAKLVHADLSEYNVLYHERQLYIIDVSQVGCRFPSGWSPSSLCCRVLVAPGIADFRSHLCARVCVLACVVGGGA